MIFNKRSRLWKKPLDIRVLSGWEFTPFPRTNGQASSLRCGVSTRPFFRRSVANSHPLNATMTGSKLKWHHPVICEKQGITYHKMLFELKFVESRDKDVLTYSSQYRYGPLQKVSMGAVKQLAFLWAPHDVPNLIELPYMKLPQSQAPCGIL